MVVLWNETLVTSILNIEYPIVQAGMAGGVTTPQLVASVSNTGGLGSLGAGYMTPDQMRVAIKEIKQITTRAFAVNLFIPEEDHSSNEVVEKTKQVLQRYAAKLGIEDYSYTEKPFSALKKEYKEKLKILIEEDVPVCSFTFGLPSKEEVQQLKRKGIILIGTATTVNEAIINEESGMDLVVMQGAEAGGHRGTFDSEVDSSLVGISSLIPQTVDAIKIPVIAAGGIMDGRGILSMLVLGAEAVQMGTAFVTCEESGAHPLHKQAILTSTEEQTMITPVFSGKSARGIKNDFIIEMTESNIPMLPGYPVLNTLTKEIRKQAAVQNHPEWMSLWSGQSPRLSTSKSAEEIIRCSVSEVKNIINRIS
ncbi:NAD(P)H-dependent flavin oxidoreductase [Guptibacillus hwajinpoensis]|uniref:NAD(P)H-dependent flavin oxidoreductase n=1 Tax=Guptibacillus hwajinpoensis TaxID=208199 RepID=UPI001CFDB06B|nr:nitronate monooxygenase [Pseudalkalibacillus hwajinpoensis]WLR61911.1 nitronate monooxygenase [Pseudalkalibacillus hwajinpoensis]